MERVNTKCPKCGCEIVYELGSSINFNEKSFVVISQDIVCKECFNRGTRKTIHKMYEVCTIEEEWEDKNS